MATIKKVKSSKRTTKTPNRVKILGSKLLYYMQCADVTEHLNTMIGLTVRGPVLTLDPNKLLRLLALHRAIEPLNKEVQNG